MLTSWHALEIDVDNALPIPFGTSCTRLREFFLCIAAELLTGISAKLETRAYARRATHQDLP